MHISRQTGWAAADSGDGSVVAIPSIRTVPLESDGMVGIVWHRTASRGQTSRHIGELAKEIVEGSGRSWHFDIGRFGNVVQSVGLHRGANHVGRLGTVAGKVRSVNRSTVAIELEGYDKLMRVGPEWRQVANPAAPPHEQAPTDKVCPAAEVVEVDGAHWHTFTDAQVATAEVLLRALVARFGFKRDVCGYAHTDFAPDAKVDPGPLWMRRHLPAILDRVFSEAT